VRRSDDPALTQAPEPSARFLPQGAKVTGPAPVKGKIRIVTAQTPKAGAEVAKGTTIRLTSKVV
jgi:hypothetical protein